MSKYDEDNTRFGLAFWGTILAVIGTLTLIYLVVGTNLIVGREFAKFSEETRNQVFKTSTAYNEGMAQNIDKLCLEYETTGNTAILASIRHRTAGYTGEFPDHLKDCVAKARKGN